MAKHGRSTEEILHDAQFHFGLAVQHANGDLGSQLTVDAVCMRLAAGVESLSHLDEDVRDRMFGAAWASMWGMRNRIAHGYLLVSQDVVRVTVKEDLPSVLDTIAKELSTADG
ncbi:MULTISPECIES: HepT-like ribonuclease domain-containing protein [unclassified Luteococcus]|uniref:HepT-like ribonuclease domain-containing protein n=1 Tax=unclassified Luteococcus TaxID=2639923 RepID=UPI00313D5DC2